MERTVSRSSLFLERWSKAEQVNAKLGVALLAVTLICLGLSGALVYAALKPRPIYYIPGALDAGLALPQSLPQTTVANFVSSWLLNWNNFTPATAQDVYKRAQRFMSPFLLAQTQARLGKDLDAVKNNNISSLFSITEEPVVTVEKLGFQVRLQGHKGIYMGKEQIKVQSVTYQVKVRMVNPSENNPYGLMIEEIDEEAAP